MGIVKTSCATGSTYHLVLNGRLTEFSSEKELIRQLVIGIEGDLISQKEWLFQRTLTPSSSSAVFPFGDSSQFYCPTSSANLAKTLNSVEGSDSLNYLQPNVIFIATDSPVKVTFGYSSTSDIFRDPTDPTLALTPQPASLNFVTLVNGYFLHDASKRNIQVAPSNSAEVAAWAYSGQAGGTVGSWSDAGGLSDTGIIFPVRFEKSSQVAASKVLLYAAYVNL